MSKQQVKTLCWQVVLFCLVGIAVNATANYLLKQWAEDRRPAEPVWVRTRLGETEELIPVWQTCPVIPESLCNTKLAPANNAPPTSTDGRIEL